MSAILEGISAAWVCVDLGQRWMWPLAAQCWLMSNAAVSIAENAPTWPAEALLRKYDQAGPRYTTYPTADRFVEDYTPADYRLALGLRDQVPQQHPLSLYVHIPFCEALCYYCA